MNLFVCACVFFFLRFAVWSRRRCSRAPTITAMTAVSSLCVRSSPLLEPTAAPFPSRPLPSAPLPPARFFRSQGSDNDVESSAYLGDDPADAGSNHETAHFPPSTPRGGGGAGSGGGGRGGSRRPDGPWSVVPESGASCSGPRPRGVRDKWEIGNRYKVRDGRGVAGNETPR